MRPLRSRRRTRAPARRSRSCSRSTWRRRRRRCRSSRTTARSCSRSSAATTASRRPSSRRRSAPTSVRRPTRRSWRASAPRAARSGPVGFKGPVVADETLREGQFVAGANRTGWHLRGVEAGRDYQAEFADIRQPKEGDACPECGGRLGFQTAIEVGHIFKLGTTYSEAFGAKYLDEDGTEKPIVMGSYGIGPGRVLAAAVEQHGDEDDGIVWPAEIAPYDVHVVVLGWDNPELVALGEQVAESLSAEGLGRPARRPRAAPRREVRRRRPDRLSAPRHRRQEDARGRRRRLQRPHERRRIADWRVWRSQNG